MDRWINGWIDRNRCVHTSWNPRARGWPSDHLCSVILLPSYPGRSDQHLAAGGVWHLVLPDPLHGCGLERIDLSQENLQESSRFYATLHGEAPKFPIFAG